MQDVSIYSVLYVDCAVLAILSSLGGPPLICLAALGHGEVLHAISSSLQCAILAVYPLQNRLDLVCQHQTAVHAGTSCLGPPTAEIGKQSLAAGDDPDPPLENPTKYGLYKNSTSKPSPDPLCSGRFPST